MADYTDEKQRRTFYKSKDWQSVRQEVLERDNYECQWCKQQGRVTDRTRATLEVDHVKELEYYPGKALDKENLRTLCRRCHNKRHNRFNGKANRKPNKWDDDEKY